MASRNILNIMMCTSESDALQRGHVPALCAARQRQPRPRRGLQCPQLRVVLPVEHQQQGIMSIGHSCVKCYM